MLTTAIYITFRIIIHLDSSNSGTELTKTTKQRIHSDAENTPK